MKTKRKTTISIKSIALILVVVTLCASFSASLFKPNFSNSGSNSKKQFLASAEQYKDLQKFVSWVDTEGNVVSTSHKYRYRAFEEQELTAVYDNIDFVISKGSSSWDSSTHTLTSSSWTDVNYLEFPLVKGMSVTVDWTIGSQTTIGLASSEDIADPSTHSWRISSSIVLFAPDYNLYYATDAKQWRYLYDYGTYDFTDCSIPWSEDLVGQTVKVKYLLADTVEIYIDDVLVTTTSENVNFDYDDSGAYYFSFAGNAGSVKLVEFGWDKDSEQVFSGVALATDYYSGKKITFLGDSITCGVGATNTATERYSTVLSTMLGATENNMGNSGWVICEGGIRNSQLANISNIPTDSDLVIVMLGTNDYDLASSSQYMFGKDGDTATTTVWGAAETMCRKLSEMFEGTDTKIIICTPIIRKSQSNDRVNSAGYTLRDISDVLMTCARRNGLLYCDINDSGYLTDADMSDTLHPNTSGHEKIAQYLAKYILSGYEYYTPYEK